MIFTPNFPSPYNPAANCNWKIKSLTGYPINIAFKSFDANGLEIIDGSSKKTRSGNILPSPILSDTDTLMLQFRTGAPISNKGFEILYRDSGNVTIIYDEIM